MITIPQRLIGAPAVEVLVYEDDRLMMLKEPSQSLTDRNSYLGMHAISIVLEGEQRCTDHEGDLIPIPQGHFAVFKKGLYLINDLISKNGKYRSLVLFFDDYVLGDFLDIKPREQRLANKEYKRFPQVFSLGEFSKASVASVETVRKRFPGSDHPFFKLKFTEIFHALLQETPELEECLKRLLHGQKRNLKPFMEHHFDKPLTVKDFAYILGRSETGFRKEFKERFGVSPRKWIVKKRMEKAAETLKEQPGIQIQNLASSVGYDNTSHFIKAFKAEHGFTPKQHTGIKS